MRGETLVAALFVLGACSAAPPPASCQTSCHEGATQCHDATLLGTCTLLADGCYAFVSVACPDGKYCNDNVNRCEVGDLCSPASTVSACTRAAMNLAKCCAYDPAPDVLCQSQLLQGLDPLASCTHLHSVDCATLHGEFLPGCCCPPGQVCDPDGLTCRLVCERTSDCPSGQSCVPQLTQGNDYPKAGAPYVCGFNSGQPYSGCNPLYPCSGSDPQYSCCLYGSCCVGDPNGNRFCAYPCTDSSTCRGGSCNGYGFMDPSCGSTKACGP